MEQKPHKNPLERLSGIHARLKACHKCSGVCGPPVHAQATVTRIMAVGQAPGSREGALGKPFAHTAGKTLFKWLKTATGLDESALREQIYFTAVARCFPGKPSKGMGDREPSQAEIHNCREYVSAEVNTLKPVLVLAIGRVAITEILGERLFPKGTPLHEVVGLLFEAPFHGVMLKVIPLPHPSGVSRWPQTEPGKTKLISALELIKVEFSRAMETSNFVWNAGPN